MSEALILSPPNSEVAPEVPEPPELLIDYMVLYHGSGTSGIQEFAPAEEDTVGQGVYFVNNPEDARGYAKRRARRVKGSAPILYEAEVGDVKLVNLDNPDKLQEIMFGFRAELVRQREVSRDTSWNVLGAIDKAIEAIDKGVRPGSVKEATHSFTSSFSTYLKSLGYDGLKTTEGGEGSDVGTHQTYLIFDPEKIKPRTEQLVH